MKAQILKIAGAKNEKDFYKMFPTQEAFMAKHGAAFKKLQKAQYGFGQPNYGQQPQGMSMQGPLPNYSFPTIPDPMDLQAAEALKGSPQTMDELINANQQSIGAPASGATKGIGKGGGFGLTEGITAATDIIQGVQALGQERKQAKSAKTWNDVSKISKKAFETPDVNTRQTIADTAKRTRKALMPTVNAESLFPAYGVGTNVLGKSGTYMTPLFTQSKSGETVSRKEDYGSKSHPYPSVSEKDFAGGGRSYPIPTEENARKAVFLAKIHHRPDVISKVHDRYPNVAQNGEIMNTYAPGDIYDDGGYEPLGESDPGFQFQSPTDDEIIKAFRGGGLVPKAQGGTPWGSIAGSASSVANSFMGGENAGGQIGGGLGYAAGSIFGGPVGGEIGKAIGSTIGTAVDPYGREIKKYQGEMMRNVGQMSGISNTRGFQSGYQGVFEDGGYLTHDWQPQVITKFGDIDVSDIHNHFFNDMRTLRTGGNIRQNQVGDIEAVSGGHLEPMSYNPYADGSGMTSMIKGQTHNESNGDHTGVLLNYKKQDGGDMSGEPQVEAENNEPVKEIGDNAVIFGDIKISKHTTGGDPEFTKYYGKTFKKAMADVAKNDASLNKKQIALEKEVANHNPITSIDKLKSNSLHLRQIGLDKKYAMNNAITKKASQYQEMVNDHAELMGVDAGALSRGKIAPNINSEVAQNGKTMAEVTQQLQNVGSIGQTNKFIEDFIKYAKAHPKVKTEKVIQKIAPKTTPKTATAPKRVPTAEEKAKFQQMVNQVTNPYYDFGAGTAPNRGITTGAPTPARASIPSANRPAVNTPIGREPVIAPIEDDIPTPVKANSRATGNQLARAAAQAVTRTAIANRMPASTQTGEPNVPNTQNLPPLSDEEYNKLQTLYNEAAKHPNKKSPETLAFQKYYHQVAPDYAKAVLASEPITGKGAAEKRSKTDLASNEDSIFGKRTKQYMGALKKVETKPTDLIPGTTTPTTTLAEQAKTYGVTPYKKSGWETLAGQILPWTRKVPGEGLQGDQLAGEMYAMSHNQLEPVQARFYHPELDVPYDISYQDQLNKNQADFNQLTKAAGNNPEALAALAAQKYGANSSVLAEQFRANQAMKDRVYSGNRATLNQAQLQNLGIADQQYQRQEQAKSMTKQTAQEALNSIASKIGQNRLENRTLQTYSNMFPDFSFDRSYRARHTGAPVDWQIDQGIYTPGEAPPGHVPMYDSKGKIKGYQEVGEDKKSETKKERQGGLVRAFKNL